MMPEQLSRRARYRRQTTEEAKQIALRQLAESGPRGISLNAIAKEMGLTGPALYRYFASRDELLRTLVTDAHDDLAAAVRQAAERSDGTPAAARLRTVASAYRNWALANAARYRLALATPIDSGTPPPERLVAALQATVRAIVDALAALAPPAPTAGRDPAPATPSTDPGPAPPAPSTEPGGPRRAQPEPWARTLAGAVVPAALAHQGVVMWARLHGLVSLELLDHFAHLGLDPDPLYDAEVDTAIATASQV